MYIILWVILANIYGAGYACNHGLLQQCDIILHHYVEDGRPTLLVGRWRLATPLVRAGWRTTPPGFLYSERSSYHLPLNTSSTWVVLQIEGVWRTSLQSQCLIEWSRQFTSCVFIFQSKMKSEPGFGNVHLGQAQVAAVLGDQLTFSLHNSTKRILLKGDNIYLIAWLNSAQIYLKTMFGKRQTCSGQLMISDNRYYIIYTEHTH